RRKICSASSRDTAASRFEGFQGSSYVWIVSRGARLHFGGGRQWRWRMQILGQLEVVVEVGKDQDGEIQSRIQRCQLRFLELPAAIIYLQLSFDDIRVCDLAALLKIISHF